MFMIKALLVSLALLSGCGIQDPRSSNEIDDLNDADPPFSIVLYDQQCQVAAENTPNRDSLGLLLTTTKSGIATTARAKTRNHHSLRNIERPAVTQNPTTKNITSEERSAKKTISSTVFANKWIRKCSTAACKDNKNIVKRYALVGTQKTLELCLPFTEYPRLSYESAAIAAQQSLASASEFFERWSSYLGFSLPQLTLSIFPEFRSHYATTHEQPFDSWKVNNLAYFASSQKIAIYPVTYPSDSNRTYLWEVPFILAHEYSHHIERSYAPILLKKHSTSSGKSLVQPFAEGIADLLAFYSVGEEPKMIEELPCFHDNRWPSQGSFQNGVKKILTSEILTSFQRPATKHTLDLLSKTCDGAFPATAYTIGSIISYQANLAISTVVNHLYHHLDMPSKIGEKYRIVLEWISEPTFSDIKSIATINPGILALNRTLRRRIREKEQASRSDSDHIQSHGINLTEKVCHSLTRGFPGLPSCTRHKLVREFLRDPIQKQAAHLPKKPPD